MRFIWISTIPLVAAVPRPESSSASHATTIDDVSAIPTNSITGINATVIDSLTGWFNRSTPLVPTPTLFNKDFLYGFESESWGDRYLGGAYFLNATSQQLIYINRCNETYLLAHNDSTIFTMLAHEVFDDESVAGQWFNDDLGVYDLSTTSTLGRSTKGDLVWTSVYAWGTGSTLRWRYKDPYRSPWDGIKEWWYGRPDAEREFEERVEPPRTISWPESLDRIIAVNVNEDRPAPTCVATDDDDLSLSGALTAGDGVFRIPVRLHRQDVTVRPEL